MVTVTSAAEDFVASEPFTTGVQWTISHQGRVVSDGAAGADFAGKPLDGDGLFPLYCSAKPLWGLGLLGAAQGIGLGFLTEAGLPASVFDAAWLAPYSLAGILKYEAPFMSPGVIGTVLLDPNVLLQLALGHGPDVTLPANSSTYSDLIPWLIADKCLYQATGQTLNDWSTQVVQDNSLPGCHSTTASGPAEGVRIVDGIVDPPKMTPNNWAHSSLAADHSTPSLAQWGNSRLMSSVLELWSRLHHSKSAPSAVREVALPGAKQFDSEMGEEVAWGVGICRDAKMLPSGSTGHTGWGGSSVMCFRPDGWVAAAFFVGLIFDDVIARQRTTQFFDLLLQGADQ